MSSARTYGEGCAAAHALDLIGERWALLVIRELLLGPKRFTDLRQGVINASPNLIAQRLKELQSAGVIRRRALPPPAATRVYELTEWGQGLRPVLMHLGRWGSRSPGLRPDLAMSTDAQILALEALFDPSAAEALDARYELRLGEDCFRIAVSRGTIELARGPCAQPDAVITTDRATLADLLWGGLGLADAQRLQRVDIDGDEHAVVCLVHLFPLPTPA